MSIKFRTYVDPADFVNVSRFLTVHFRRGNKDGNWLQPIWEYMHSHPYLDVTALDRIGIWECDGEIVAVVHYESTPGEVFFEFHPAFQNLKPELLDYAEHHLLGISEEGQIFARIYVHDADSALEAILQERGYALDEDYNRPMSWLPLLEDLPVPELPTGYRVQSLADENDLVKINRVLWRGFNHDGEPPDDLSGRIKMQSTPNFRKELTMVAVAPDGQYAAFAGFWYQPENRIAYVEPVATDPQYRRMGLGKAAVIEGLRRCAALGALEAFVGSEQLFYQAMGFRKIFDSRCWLKFF